MNTRFRRLGRHGYAFMIDGWMCFGGGLNNRTIANPNILPNLRPHMLIKSGMCIVSDKSTARKGAYVLGV